MEPLQNEKLFIVSVDHYLSLIKEQKVRDCYSGLQYLAQKLSDKKLAVRANVAEQIRERYKVSKRAFYGANRGVEVTSQTTLDIEG